MVNTIKALTRWKAVLLIALFSRIILFIFSLIVNHSLNSSLFDLWIQKGFTQYGGRAGRRRDNAHQEL